MTNNDNADLSAKVYLECKCTDFDHTVRFSLWDWNNYTDPAKSTEPEMTVEYHLNNHEYWYQRIWTAVKYVLNYENIVYHDVLLDHNSVKKLNNLIKDYHTAYTLYETGTQNEPR